MNKYYKLLLNSLYGKRTDINNQFPIIYCCLGEREQGKKYAENKYKERQKTEKRDT